MGGSIALNPLRVGSFTSSDIHKLLTVGKDKKSLGAPGKTYVLEKNIERKLGRGLKPETYTQAMAWGTLCESFLFEEILGTEFEHNADETINHPTILFWAGSCDLLVQGERISEIKCYQPKKFCLYTDAVLSQDIEFIKEEFPDEYWQAVSNAIINQVPRVELMTYMPFRSELPKLRQFADDWDGADQWKYRFVTEKDDSWLPWLPDNGNYNNVNRFEFEVPTKDIEQLTDAVLRAGELLVEVCEPKPVAP